MSADSDRLARLSALAEEIRGCKDCETDVNNETGVKNTPFVYMGADPKILVVSERPSKGAWKNNTGSCWKDGKLFVRGEKGIDYKLCKQLGVGEDLFKERVFWVQRANCWIRVGKEYAFQHCSEKFLRRIIETLEPNLIITLGVLAAQYFFQFDTLSEILEEKDTCIRECTVWRRSYKCMPLPHPSPTNATYREYWTEENGKMFEGARNYFMR